MRKVVKEETVKPGATRCVRRAILLVVDITMGEMKAWTIMNSREVYFIYNGCNEREILKYSTSYRSI